MASIVKEYRYPANNHVCIHMIDESKHVVVEYDVREDQVIPVCDQEYRDVGQDSENGEKNASKHIELTKKIQVESCFLQFKYVCKVQKVDAVLDLSETASVLLSN